MLKGHLRENYYKYDRHSAMPGPRKRKKERSTLYECDLQEGDGKCDTKWRWRAGLQPFLQTQI